MSTLIALAGLATYIAQQPVEHDGKPYPVGAPIELDATAAQPLLDVRAIGHADGNAAQALQAAGTDSVAALLDDLFSRDEQLSEARNQVNDLQARVAELSQAMQDQANEHAAELQGLREQRDTLTAQRDEASKLAADLQAQLDQAKAEASTAARTKAK